MDNKKLADLALAYWRLNNWVTNVNVERKTAAFFRWRTDASVSAVPHTVRSSSGRRR